ncbi:MSCRAMM family adhesin SdrC [Halorubrum sp. SD612]|uniref:MSCRAMM family adhesin SdrC n=1 Tax=Halorubrum sp. SD612 TaxID=1855863 RepID=UPI001E613949|nr:MSCRAMM family adhesin SdrC [Halorubrum sp. SD612]
MAFTDGDEVAPGSNVYLDAADSENADKYVQFDASDEVRLQFDGVPPGSRTRADDLFIVGFDGYQDSDNATTVGLSSSSAHITLKRMDTGATFDSGEITLQPGESVTFGVIIETDQASVTGTVDLEVKIPDEDTTEGNGGGGTGGGAGSGGGGSSPGDGTDDASDNTEESDGNGPETDSGGGDTDGTEGTGTESGDTDDGETDPGAGDNTGGSGDSENGSSTDPDTQDSSSNETASDGGGDAADPALEPGGLQFGTVTLRWSLFGGILAAFTNYLVQTRLRDQSPVFRFDRSQRRERLKPVLFREAAIGVGVFVITVAVAGLLSGAGVSDIGQLAVTLIFSGVAGGVTGYRRFPSLDLSVPPS